MDDEMKERIIYFADKTRIISLSACIRFMISYTLDKLEDRIDAGEINDIVEEIPGIYRRPS